MKTKLFLIAMLLMSICSCDIYDELNHIESESESSTSEEETECSFSGVTAGIHVKAMCVNSNTIAFVSLYANSDVVDEARIVSERHNIDKTVQLPYNEEFDPLTISLNTKYDFIIKWGDDGQLSEIHIYYIITLLDGELTVYCSYSNSSNETTE